MQVQCREMTSVRGKVDTSGKGATLKDKVSERSKKRSSKDKKRICIDAHREQSMCRSVKKSVVSRDAYTDAKLSESE